MAKSWARWLQWCASGVCLSASIGCGDDPLPNWTPEAMCMAVADGTEQPLVADGTWCTTSVRGASPAMATCQRDSDCLGNAVCPPGYGFCVTPCQTNADCAMPTTCLLDRLDVNFCG
jgi:hypothetical protein